ncbi:metallophosphoesterase [Clostridium saccharoperbutylacetonicum]
MTILIVLVVLMAFVLLSYYIGRKVKFAIEGIGIDINDRIKHIVYWIIYWSIALSFIFSNILRGVLSTDNFITETSKIIGAIYLGFFFYSILILPLVDLLKFIIKKINFKITIKKRLKKIYCNGISVFIVILIILAFGAWNCQHKVVTNYEVNVNKNAGSLNSLNVVMLSDVHIGIGLRKNGISQMVNSINALKPDVVVFCGDIFDDSTTTELKEYSRDEFKNIKSKYGVYAITGNHEYGAGNLTDTITYFEDANIKYLQDQSIKIADSFYIIGRNDQGQGGNSGHNNTAPLNEILKDTDKSLPMIVLNHRPDKLEEAEAENIDLQLSGHTHKGQLFPGNLIINAIYEDAYGLLKKDNFNLIVSSGYGTWGPPIRTGSNSEIVKITINFNKP